MRRLPLSIRLGARRLADFDNTQVRGFKIVDYVSYENLPPSKVPGRGWQGRTILLSGVR